MTATVAALVLGAASCGTDDGLGGARAGQVRRAAAAAGFEEPVVDFLALAARGDTATYTATYPGTSDGTEIVVTSRPPDRRVDIRGADVATEARLTLAGEAHRCGADGDGVLVTCEPSEGVPTVPGIFSTDVLDEVIADLAAQQDDFTFEVTSRTLLDVTARCLVTTIRPGRSRASLGDTGELCLSDQGVILLVDRDDDRFVATAYSTDIDPERFVLPDP